MAWARICGGMTTTLLAAGAAAAALAYALYRRSALDNRRRNTWTQQRPLYLSVGFVVALAAVGAAFEWTVAATPTPEVTLGLPSDEAIVIPRTDAPAPPVAPPPPPKPDPVVAELELLEDLAEEEAFEEALTELPPVMPTEGTVSPGGTVASGPPAPPAPPAPAPPPPAPEGDDIVDFAERMPMFPGCEGVEDYDERRACAEAAMLKHIYGEIRYPTIAKENGVEGRAVLRFTVEKDGGIADVTVVRGPKAGIDAEAARVVEGFPRWTPGRQGGRPVRVRFTLPIEFRLER